jgi:type 1 fimbria pilin
MNVKKILAMTLAALVAALAFGPALAGGADTVELSGWIVDKSCGKANANAKGKDCILACNKSGSPLVLAAGDKLWALSDQKAALANVGHEVVVKGTAADGTITVTSIEKKKA